MADKDLLTRALEQSPLGTPDDPPVANKRNYGNLSRALNRPAFFDVGELARVGGDQGAAINPEDSKPYLGVNDSLGSSLKNTGARLAAGATSMLVGSIGALGDFIATEGEEVGLISEDASEYLSATSRVLHDLASDYRQESEADYATYRENPDDIFDFSDPQFWLDTIKSVGESAPIFAVLGAGAGALTARVAQGIKGARALKAGASAGVRAGRAVQLGGQAATSFGLSYVEGGVEGYQVFQDAIREGRSVEEASEAAAATARFNLLNGVLNMTILTPAFSNAGRIRSQVSQLKRAGFKRKAGESMQEWTSRIKKADPNGTSLGRRAAAYAGESAQESLEEFTNFVAAEYGAATLDDDNITLREKAQLFADALTNEEALYGAFSGAFGGAAQRGIIRRLPTSGGIPGSGRSFASAAARERYEQSEGAKQLRDNVVRTVESVLGAQQELQQAIENDGNVLEAQDNLFRISSLNSVINGTEAGLIAAYTEIADMTPEQAREQDISNDDYHHMRRKAEEKIKDIKDLSIAYEGLLAKHSTQEERESRLPQERLALDATLKSLRSQKEDLERENQQDEQFLKETFGDLNLNPAQQQIARLNLDIADIEGAAQSDEAEASNIGNWWDNKQKRDRVRQELGLPANRNRTQVAAALRQRATELREEIPELEANKEEVVSQLPDLQDSYQNADAKIEDLILIRDYNSERIKNRRGELSKINNKLRKTVAKVADLNTKKGQKAWVEAYKKEQESEEKKAVKKEAENVLSGVKDPKVAATDDPKVASAKQAVSEVESVKTKPTDLAQPIEVGSIVELKPGRENAGNLVWPRKVMGITGPLAITAPVDGGVANPIPIDDLTTVEVVEDTEETPTPTSNVGDKDIESIKDGIAKATNQNQLNAIAKLAAEEGVYDDIKDELNAARQRLKEANRKPPKSDESGPTTSPEVAQQIIQKMREIETLEELQSYMSSLKKEHRGGDVARYYNQRREELKKQADKKKE